MAEQSGYHVESSVHQLPFSVPEQLEEAAQAPSVEPSISSPPPPPETMLKLLVKR